MVDYYILRSIMKFQKYINEIITTEEEIEEAIFKIKSNVKPKYIKNHFAKLFLCT
jgi:hypothetical protein